MTKTLDLCLHCGGDKVTREELEKVATPKPTKTWHPIPHAALVAGIQKTVARSGLQVVTEAHALAREGARYFGLLQVANGHNPDDYGLVLGIRNSHDRSLVAGIACGSQVFVCDNLAFSGEVVIARKHTVHLERDLPTLIESAVGRLGELRGTQDGRIAAYKETEITDAQVNDLVIQALDARIVPVTRIPDVLSEYRSPRHPEFVKDRNAWRLFNAFTETLKESSLFNRPIATQALHGLMDTACGLANKN